MLRRTVHSGVRANRPHEVRRVAPAPVRVALIAACAGGLASLVGGPHGFWVCVPLVLLASTVGVTVIGALAFAAPVAALSAVVASLVQSRGMPPAWLMAVVPGTCVLVLHAMGRRLRHERDAMEQAAFSDPLTGLANRRLLMSRAEYEIARHQRSEQRFMVVMLDLDGFKQLNDRYGHAAGDQMLRDVAVALTRALRSQDTIARLGGDEFCVIAPETDNPQRLAEKIVTSVAGAANGYDSLQTSVGVSVFPQDGGTIDALLRTADDRLIAAKRKRRERSQRRAA